MIIYKNTHALEQNVAAAEVVMTSDSPMKMQF